jgi:hypothetical protein
MYCKKTYSLFFFFLLYSKFRSDYICRVRYRNALPGIPYTAKMLTIPSLMERHASYQTTSLVQQTPYSLTMDQSATIPFDKSVIDYLDAMETSPDEGEFQGWKRVSAHTHLLLTLY